MDFSKFDMIGITVRTTNENGQMAVDIVELWRKFFAENLLEKIPNKIDSTIYSVYTDYEGDYTKPYSVVLGCRVKDLKAVPEGLVGRSFSVNPVVKFTAKGNLHHGVVFKEWQKIWNTPLNRSYIADFEVYGEKAANPENVEVDIFIGLK